MTTDAERECYYRLAREAYGRGAIVELGAWMGASTAYVAAAIRDSGGGVRAQVYDKFQSKPGHVKKVQTFYAKRGLAPSDMPLGDVRAQVLKNLGDLARHVVLHRCQIENVEWDGGRIALLVTDAPKRVHAISSVLTNFGKGIQRGTVMAWQDFCHFPSYEIPACLYRLRGHLEFVEAIVPGTTLVFRVGEPWSPAQVSLSALGLDSWTPADIEMAWEYWAEFVPTEKFSLFRCGRAMFLCDIGRKREGVKALEAVLRDDADAVLPKWRYLREARPDFVVRYAPLFACLDEMAMA